MTTLEILLSVITALSGVGNLTQWANLRALRNKSHYEAEDVHIEVLKKTIQLQAEEIARLQERQKELEEKIEKLEKALTTKTTKKNAGK